ncbi:MAG: hypothetical protein GC150_03570 [Rhizobiales bacterium]|nr:hypothetical protein [Hyphomicrobiales bacterium]
MVLPRLLLAFMALALAMTMPLPGSRAEDRPRLRIASWHLGGLALSMPDGTGGRMARPQEDFERLAQVAGKLDADVVALQGVSNLQALRRLFPARTHHVVFSRQAITDVRSSGGAESAIGADDLGYTAIAVRRSELIRAMRQQHLPEFVDQGAVRAGLRPRAATALEVRFAGETVWVLSADLLEGCEPTVSPTAPACTALLRQSELIADWMGRRERAGIAYVVAGRLARPLPPPGEVLDSQRHPLWAALHGVGAEAPPQPPLMPSRIAPLPEKFDDPLLTVSTPGKEVRLPQFNPPSRAPNERLADRLAREREAMRQDEAATPAPATPAAVGSPPVEEKENGLLASVLAFLGVAGETAPASDTPPSGNGAEMAEEAGETGRNDRHSEIAPDRFAPAGAGGDIELDGKPSVKTGFVSSVGPPPDVAAARGVIAIPPFGTPDVCRTRRHAPAETSERGTGRDPDEFLVIGRTMPAIASIANSALLNYEVPQGWTPPPVGAAAPPVADWAARLPRRCPIMVDLLVTPAR